MTPASAEITTDAPSHVLNYFVLVAVQVYSTATALKEPCYRALVVVTVSYQC
jgi:hypothetical protein